MGIVVSVLLLLAGVGVLLGGVLSIVRELPELDSQGDPSFQDNAAICIAPGGSEGTSLCNDGWLDNQQARSQFAWQSRSHFRAPD